MGNERKVHKDCRVTSSVLRELLQAVGFSLTEPMPSSELEAQLAAFPIPVPSELRDLYATCNGGYSEAYALQIIDAAESCRMAHSSANHSMAYLPFIVRERYSDEPCCVCGMGPLMGFVVFSHHEEGTRFAAPSLEGFFRMLAETEPSPAWVNEAHRCTADEFPAMRRLLALADKLVESTDYEFRELFCLAASSFPDEHLHDIVQLLQHRDWRVRQIAQERLHPVEDHRIVRALDELDYAVGSFAHKAVDVLRAAGIRALIRNRYEIHVGTQQEWLNVRIFFDKRDSADCWDFLIEQATSLVSEQRRRLP